MSRINKRVPSKITPVNYLIVLGTSMFLSSVLLLLFTPRLFAQETLSSSPSPTPSNSSSQQQQRPITLQEYHQVLQTERQILEDQSKEYYSRVANFAYISLGVLGVAFSSLFVFFGWMFGQTRREAVSQIKSDLQSSAFLAKEELERFRRENIQALTEEYQKLKAQLEEVTSFGKQQVIWLLTDAMEKPEAEIAALRAVGLARVVTCAPKVDSAEEVKEALKKADLAIITFDGSAEARALTRHAAAALKFRYPPVSLLIYTYGFYLDDKQVHLTADDLEQLKGLSSFAPANFPATLISQAQSLIIKSRAVV